MLDVAALLPVFFRPLRYKRVRSATFQRGPLGTTVSMQMKGRVRVAVRVRHDTAQALMQALKAYGITTAESSPPT
jgi:hypothetical protein